MSSNSSPVIYNINFLIVHVVGRIECLEILFKSGTEVNCKDKKVSLC